MTLFIIAQILSVATLVLNCVVLQLKSVDKSLVLILISNVIGFGVFALLNAWSGAGMLVVATIRTAVFFALGRKKIRSIEALFICEFLVIAVGVATWSDFLTIFLILGFCIYTYGLWQSKMYVLRWCNFIITIIMIIYNFVVMAYVNVVSEVIILGATIFALARYYRFARKVRKMIADAHAVPFSKRTIDKKE